MTITENAAYLKGLLEGMNIDADKPEGKLLAALVDVVNDLALEVSDTQDDVETLNAYIEEIDEDLGDVEEFVYGGDFDDEFIDDYDYEDEDFFPDDDEDDAPAEIEAPSED